MKIVALALVGLAACSSAPLPFYRFVDREPGGPYTVDIQETRQRVLDPARSEHVFPLAGMPATGTLDFSVGLSLPQWQRFEIVLETDDAKPVVVFRKDVIERGWYPERVSLTVRDPARARLIFRTTVYPGAGSARAVWANPTLLTGARGDAPSVVLISLDTLRADRVGVYGHPTNATPVLDGLARAGTLFETAYSPSMSTYPSHQAFLKGVYPRSTNGDPAVRPVADLLRDSERLTAAFTGGGWISATLGFDRGFDTYYSHNHNVAAAGSRDPTRFDGPVVFASGAAWLARHAGAPFFLLLHTYDVHDRAPFIDAFKSPFEAAVAWNTFPPARQAEMVAYYDRLVEEVDVLVGRFLAELDRLGLAERTLVVVTSDHGEGLWEHRMAGHGCNKPYEEFVRVPLLLRWPGRVPADRRIAEPVSLVDVAPTMLALLGLPVPAWMHGRVLPGIDAPPDGAPGPPVFTHCDDWLMVRGERYKLITFRTNPHIDELYDLAEDPKERTSLILTRRSAADPLREQARAYWAGSNAASPARPAPEQLDEPTRARLRALGYLE